MNPLTAYEVAELVKEHGAGLIDRGYTVCKCGKGECPLMRVADTLVNAAQRTEEAQNEIKVIRSSAAAVQKQLQDLQDIVTFLSAKANLP